MNCWAYQPVAGSKTAWVPCVREAAEGSKFCGRHGVAITGAMLGMLMPRKGVGALLARSRRRGAEASERKEES